MFRLTLPCATCTTTWRAVRPSWSLEGLIADLRGDAWTLTATGHPRCPDHREETQTS